MFEVLCFGWGDAGLEEDFEKDGISVHVENACVTEEVTAVSPLQVDAVVFASNSKGMSKPEMTKYIDRYEKAVLRVWLQDSPDDFNTDLIQREKFLVVHGQHRCQTVLKQFFSQMCGFLTKLTSKLDLNDSKTVEFEDLAVYAEEFGMELMPQDLDFFLAEYQDEGDSFLTARGILKWVKKGKPDCKVGTIILKVIEAKNLLKGHLIVLKKIFLGDEIPAAKLHQLQGDLEITVGEKGFVPGARLDAGVWSRNRLPHTHPADLLNLSPTDSQFIVSVTLRRNPERSFTQIQDFMRNTVYKVESLLITGGPGEAETMVTVDYRITDTDATFYLIPDFSIMASRDSSIRRDLKALVAVLSGSSGYEGHLTLESKTGLKDMLAQATDHFQDFLGVGIRAALTYALDSSLRDLLYSFAALPAELYPYFLVRNLVLKSHFAGLTDLPQELQQVVRKTIPTQTSTLSALFSLFGEMLNKTCRHVALEKQIELMLQTTADLFDMTEVKAGVSFFNVVGEAVLQLQGLDELLRTEMSELRRKADEMKRARQAESKSGSGSGSEDSTAPRRRPAEMHESVGSGSVKSRSSEIKAEPRRSLIKGSDSDHSGSAMSPRERSLSRGSGSVTPPRRQDSQEALPALLRKASIGSGEEHIVRERKASIERSASPDSRGSLSD